MSGGSYDYLYRQGAPSYGTGANVDPKQFEAMARRLEELGYRRLAEDTRRSSGLFEDDPVESRFPGLRAVRKAVEWWDSGDWIEEDATLVADGYERSRAPPLPPIEFSD